jgi:hypothetical protein
MKLGEAKRGGSPSIIRRRPSPLQGRALEVLGHAIEYLVDSYITTASPTVGSSDQEATHVLIKLNMSVFSDCSEIVPLRQRFWRYLRSGLSNAHPRHQG